MTTQTAIICSTVNPQYLCSTRMKSQPKRDNPIAINANAVKIPSCLILSRKYRKIKRRTKFVNIRHNAGLYCIPLIILPGWSLAKKHPARPIVIPAKIGTANKSKIRQKKTVLFYKINSELKAYSPKIQKSFPIHTKNGIRQSRKQSR